MLKLEFILTVKVLDSWPVKENLKRSFSLLARFLKLDYKYFVSWPDLANFVLLSCKSELFFSTSIRFLNKTVTLFCFLTSANMSSYCALSPSIIFYFICSLMTLYSIMCVCVSELFMFSNLWWILDTHFILTIIGPYIVSMFMINQLLCLLPKIIYSL
jgi:hypothetical protein